MSSRGRRSFSPLRRPIAPLGVARVAGAGLASGGHGSSDPFSEIDPLDELDRILGAKQQRFRLLFFAVADGRGPTIVLETEIDAADASGAIRAAADADWP